MMQQRPLPPHTYPILIKISGITCLLLLLISMTELPYLIAMNSKTRKAKEAFLNKNYADACSRYIELTQLLPKNKKLKLRAAEILFSSSHKIDHMLALDVLKNEFLGDKEWKELQEYMPKEYVSMFTDCEPGSK